MKRARDPCKTTKSSTSCSSKLQEYHRASSADVASRITPNQPVTYGRDCLTVARPEVKCPKRKLSHYIL
eukprot:g30526.t1